MALIKFLLIVVLVVYLIGFVGRLLFRMWIRKIRKEFIGSGGNGPAGSYYRQYTWGKSGENRKKEQKEGEVQVRAGNSPRQRINREIGDYVDYEEVK